MTSKVSTLLRAPGVEDPGRVDGAGTGRPDPEVPERAKRRTFTAKYKLEILAEYDTAAEGEKGALLRREGLYSSHIVEWRKARDAGALAGLAGRKHGGGVGPSRRRSLTSCTAPGSSTCRRPRSGPRCSTKAAIWGRSPRSTGSCATQGKVESGAAKPLIPRP